MKVVYDTNVLIEFFRNSEARRRFEDRERRPRLYLSAVVMMELMAGCRTRAQRNALTSFVRPFEKAARIIVPTTANWKDAGSILARLGSEGLGNQELRRLANDVLIAVSSAREGATVVTRNQGDFARIGACFPIRWTAPE